VRKTLLKSLVSSVLIVGTVYGAQTKTEISELYVSILNRASEGEGNRYWQTNQENMVNTANVMLKTDDAKSYFGTSLNSNQAFIEHVYKNTLNKTFSDDPDGINYWVNELKSGKSRGEVVVALINAVLSYKDSTDSLTQNAYNQFINRVTVSDYMADTVEKAPSDYATSTSFSHDLVVTSDSSTVTTAKESINTIILGNSGENKPPVVDAGADKTVTVNQSVTLIGTATDSDGTIVSYEWKKGSEVLGTEATLVYTPTIVGTDTLTLTVTDDDGAVVSDTAIITVESEAELPGFGGKK